MKKLIKNVKEKNEFLELGWFTCSVDFYFSFFFQMVALGHHPSLH